MTQKENNKSVENNYRKYLLFFLIPLIGIGLYQIMQENSKDIPSSNQPDAVEKSMPTTKEKLETADLSKNKEESQAINSEQTATSNAEAGIFTDARDGQTYQWVRLKDDKKWLTQNLNYKMEDTWCFEEKEDNCNKYGRLYTWEAANTACPNGWRLPTDDEWWTMASYYGKAYNSYRGQEKMEGKDDGELAYQALIQGGNTGFAVLLGGSHSSDEGFNYLGELGCYWSRSENGTANALGYYFYIHSKGLARDNYNKRLGFSCRCMQD